MIKFALDEYIKNIWYNMVTVLLISVSIIVSVIFISNLLQETKVYRLIKPYLNEKSIIINVANDIEINSLVKVDKTFMTNELYCVSDNQIGLTNCVVYNEEVLDIMSPRLIEGQGINTVSENEEALVVWISPNSGGLGTGDRINLNFFSEIEAKTIKVEAVIAGVIADGQRIFMSDTTLSSDMKYEDIYCLYSYKQLGSPIVITTEEEIEKIGETVHGQNKKCIVKFSDDITEEEWRDNYFKVVDMEMEQHGYSSIGTFPDSEELYKQMMTSVKITIMKYVPLSIGVLVLIIVCILGIVLVKNANSVRYYHILSICGMKKNGAVLLTCVEMIANCVLAVLITISFVKIQNAYAIVGKINCSLGGIQILTIIATCLSVVIASMGVLCLRKFQKV